MKFNNGGWVNKEGTELFSPAQVYFTKITENELTICAPSHKIPHRAYSLQGANLTIRITAPAPDIFRIRISHNLGVQKKSPEFALNQEELQLLTEEQDNTLIITNGDFKIQINKSDWNMSFHNADGKLTESGTRDIAYIKTAWKGDAYNDGTNDDAYMRESLGLSVGELIYGLGERFTPFVKNGQTVDLWNEDGGTSSELSYKNIPFFVSNRGYGVFVNHPEKVSFEIGSHRVERVQFSVPGEELDYYIINGPTIREVLEHYTGLTGKPPIPPAWTFGLWLSTSFVTDYDENTVNSFVDGMFKREIPLNVFHFDCFWMKEYHWCDFLWDTKVFPDPEGMLKRLKAKGLKICVWINSYIGQESYLFDEGVKGGYFIKNPNGDVWQWDMWQAGMAIVDFTNPKACEWYASKLEALLDMGVDCFKTDFGERIPTNAVYYDGSDPIKMHNYYSYLYNKTVYDLLKRKRGVEDAVLFARSATVGGQKFPVHWGGDCNATYESMAESLRGGLSLTMSGFGFWSHDIGGFENTASPDVYKRWCAFGLLSTHSRLHGSYSYRVPWNYDEEAVDVLRFFTKLKVSLMPYLFRNAVDTSKTGIPSMRSMIMEFTKDPVCGYLDRQYMLGDSLLVAPVFDKDGLVEYYLPEGNWTDYFTGEVKAGCHWYREQIGYQDIPLMVKQGSILAIGAHDDNAVYDYADNVSLKLYELQENQVSETVVYDEHAQPVLTAKVLRSNGEITIDVVSEKNFRIVLINEDKIASVTNASFSLKGKDTVIIPQNAGQITCSFTK